MIFEEKLKTFWEIPENRAKFFVICWYISLGMMVLGYLIMMYLLYIEMT
jgi:hypothetical protein